MIIKDSILIRKKLQDVYKVARDVENQHKFIPGYSPAKILERKDNSNMTIERTAVVDGKIMNWKSTAEFVTDDAIRFVQIEGALKGMKIDWKFRESGEGTEVEIVHDFNLNIPLVGWLAERFVARPKIEKITRNVLAGLKSRMEEYAG